MKRTAALTLLFSAFALALPLAAREHIKNVTFERGQSASTLRGSVVRGDRDVYVVRVRAGQVMSVSATAVENNVALSIFEPKANEAIRGTEEEHDLTSWNGTLAKSGAYRIVVGGTRGNATYSLQVSVK